MFSKSIRLTVDDQRELDRIVNTALMVIDGGRGPQPFIGRGSGIIEAVGIVVGVEWLSLITRHHHLSEDHRIRIHTSEWSFTGACRVTIHDYSGSAKQYSRNFAMSVSGLLHGDETKFRRDILMFRLNRNY